MNINTGVMSLNVNNMLVKRQLDKEQIEKNVSATLKIKENVNVETEIKDINVTNENLVASESDIKNIDMAEALLKRTKDSILEQSAMALLSQANKNSSDVITLLQ